MRDINEDEPLEDSLSIVIQSDDNDSHKEESGQRDENSKRVSVTLERVELQNIVAKFSRSHSTGHSIDRARGAEDRFTLKLPEHVRAKIIKGHNSTKSCTTFGEYKSKTTTGNGGFVGFRTTNFSISVTDDGFSGEYIQSKQASQGRVREQFNWNFNDGIVPSHYYSLYASLSTFSIFQYQKRFTLLNMVCTGISFFTLSAVAILTSMINLPPSYCGILGWFILVVYEVFLLLGLNEYLLSNERGHDIISQNKEGIFSIFVLWSLCLFGNSLKKRLAGGVTKKVRSLLNPAHKNSSFLDGKSYWGLYLVCVQLGNYLFFGKPGDAVLRTNDWARIRVWIFWLSTVFLDRHVERVSRRMCNLAYVTVTLAMNLQVFAVLTLADYVPGYKVAALMEVFDRNLLGSFLLANVLTGLVNLSLYTLSVSPFTALANLVGYAYILSIAAAVAHFNCIRLKFW
ncbi:hypothetical protein K7X08_020947 [Anisodus acutangulus]|uniref:Uncharacterized protein n=1 Tax=Anisodus acutangulus TaxID=402998 RepID=A0A9Q1MTF8_9SOLA|nr:hypothetical protein K7X08_020947 [Anisodus acutangulus]